MYACARRFNCFYQDITADPDANEETFLQGRVTVGLRPLPMYGRAGVVLSVQLPGVAEHALMVVHAYNIGTGTYDCMVAGATGEETREMTAAQVDQHAMRVGDRLAVVAIDLDPHARALSRFGEFIGTGETITCTLALPDDDDVNGAPVGSVWVTVMQSQHRTEMGRYLAVSGTSPTVAAVPRTFRVSVHALRSVPRETSDAANTFMHLPIDS